MPDLTVYSHGLMYASVCTDLPVEAAAKRLNRELPTGITSTWSVANEPFANGDANPRPCEQLPETHKHYLFSC